MGEMKEMSGRKLTYKILASIFILIFGCPLLWAGTPEELVRRTTDEVLTILKDPSLKGEEKIQERKEKLWVEVSMAFDFEEISKRALGRHWRKRSSEEKKEFMDLFSRIIQDAYIGKIDTYSGEEILYLGEKLDSRYAAVQTKIVANTGTEITVDYRLIDKQGKWGVYDIVIEGVSLVNNYRTQFNNILVRSSYEKLIERIKEKNKEEKVSVK
jgi:phospholipid transport system substrate-binding protein